MVISNDHKNVMEYDLYTQEIMYTQKMSDFFSTAEIVTGCIFKMEDNSFSWKYKIELNKQYGKFGDLMNFLLDYLVEDENDKICTNDFTGRHLLDRICNDLIWRTIEQSRMNAQLVSLATTLNGGNNTMNIITAESSKKIEVSYTTIADTLTMHYPIEESNLN